MKKLVLSVTMMMALAVTSAFAASTKSVRNTTKPSNPAVSQTTASGTTTNVKKRHRRHKRLHKSARAQAVTPKKN